MNATRQHPPQHDGQDAGQQDGQHPHWHMHHPGPLAPERFSIGQTQNPLHLTGTLKAGLNLHDAIFTMARAFGRASGTLSLVGGGFAKTVFTTGGPDRHKTGKAANYTFIRSWGEVHVVDGEIAFGPCETESEFVHCHALFHPAPGAVPARSDSMDSARRSDVGAGPAPAPTGGHLMARDCLISDPIRFHATLFDGFAIKRKFDSETLHSIFEVEAEPAMSASDKTIETASDKPDGTTISPGRFGRVVFIRLRPNEDLVEGLEKAAKAHGIAAGVLRGSIGSVNHPVFDIGSSRQTSVDKIGLEIVSLKGTLSSENGSPEATLTGALVDDDGTVFAGRFIRGKAPVCITAELCLEEWLPDLA